MEDKTQYQAELFANRLRKKYRELRKWARKNRISCYRLYEKDIPEVPVSLDLYEFLPSHVTSVIDCAKHLNEQNQRLSANDPAVEKEIKLRTYAVLYLYERPYEKSDEEEALWLEAMARSASEVLDILPSHIIKKERKHQKGENQYEKNSSDAAKITGLVQEQGQLFTVDLTTYLDTGLFFDHRPLRQKIREDSHGKNLLNLFCYTGSFSVYAAQGNARSVTSVDLSKTYLSWAKRNLEQNDFSDRNRFFYIRSDVNSFLQKTAESDEKKYDIIILDPPTFSNSKATQGILDINRDWPKLVMNCMDLLSEKGTLYFSTNSTKLSFKEEQLSLQNRKNLSYEVKDLTAWSVPKDFTGTKCHRLWEIRLK